MVGRTLICHTGNVADNFIVFPMHYLRIAGNTPIFANLPQKNTKKTKENVLFLYYESQTP